MPHRRRTPFAPRTSRRSRRSFYAAAATAAVSVVSAVSALALTTPAATAAPIPLPEHRTFAAGSLLPVGDRVIGDRVIGDRVIGVLAPTDHLTVTVTDSGSARTDGTYELYCHPDGGSHRAATAACDAVDRQTKWGKDPFAPVRQGARCTMMYGGPATAHVTGTWAGRPVNADFRRTNGCEISRWGRFEPLLPVTTS
ncbi:SSI family serine proteinase inhibitor [Streptomyces sp. NPDC101393]|uniref:SSI family serine proteinase inhibitor n=1 Tax=Streptomyces sp. NPDC101393 TaxID=3366141 RepID=UPI003826EAF2